jgi:uncharacterized protein (DUF934 family)
MPLVNAGHIVEDRFVRVLDDAPVPEGVAVILPAARLLADARELVLRQAPTGIVWPNDRKLAELAPDLDWIALVALVFPNFRDGRAYSQARLLRERPCLSRRATRDRPDPARPALVSATRRLRRLRGDEGGRRGSIRGSRTPL